MYIVSQLKQVYFPLMSVCSTRICDDKVVMVVVAINDDWLRAPCLALCVVALLTYYARRGGGLSYSLMLFKLE